MSSKALEVSQALEDIVNLKNEVDKKKLARLFVEEFHTPCHIFLCVENTSGLKV